MNELMAMNFDYEAFVTGLAVWAAKTLPQFIAAFAILIIGFWFARSMGRGVGRLVDSQSSIDPTLRSIAVAVVRYTISIIVIVAALSQIGVQTTSILAALGAAGLAIALALQGTLANVAAGVMLLFLRPFRVGDKIELQGNVCQVTEVGLFATKLKSWDGIYQFVPNSELWNKHLVNYSTYPTRLIDLSFGINYADDVALGKRVLNDIAKADPRILQDPPVKVFVSELGADAVALTLRAWVKGPEYYDVRNDLSEAAKLAIEDAGLSFPFPQRDVHHYGLPDLTPPSTSAASVN